MQHGHSCGGSDHVQTHPLQAFSLELQNARHAIRNVDDPGGNVGASVVDPYDHSPSIAQVGDADLSAQGQLTMGGSHVVHIIGFAAGRRPAVEIASVPGSRPHLIGLGASCSFA